MIIVLDASAAIEIALGNEYAQQFSKILKESDLVMAPDIFPSEITNVFWKYAQFSGLSLTKCEAGIDCCNDLIDDYIETKNMCREVFSESIRLKHSSYDIFYLSVARRNNALLLTKDKKLSIVAEEIGIRTIKDNI